MRLIFTPEQEAKMKITHQYIEIGRDENGDICTRFKEGTPDEIKKMQAELNAEIQDMMEKTRKFYGIQK